MAFPVVLAIFQAMLASVPWLPAHDSEDEDDNDENQEEDAADIETALAAWPICRDRPLAGFCTKVSPQDLRPLYKKKLGTCLRVAPV